MLSRVNLSLADDIGTMYSSMDKFYRGINPDKEEYTHELFDSGLIRALVKKGLFPQSDISEKRIDGYSLVIEHESVGVPSYPFEWSPEMLRAAGLCIAEVNDVCNQWGYELKDAHPFNVVFSGCKPKFVDLGSISKVRVQKRDSWLAFGEFERSISIPLYFYEKGATNLFRNAFVVPARHYEYTDYLAFRYGLMRKLNPKGQLIFALLFEAYRRFPLLNLDKRFLRRGRWMKPPLKALQASGLIPLRGPSSKYLKASIERFKLSKKTTWGGYQSEAGFLDPDGDTIINERFRYVLGLVNSVRPAQVTELAGNQGILSEEISEFEFVERVVCTDVDEQAIDSLIKRVGVGNDKLHPMVLNFMFPVCNILTKPVEERICADLVIALAITHHLSLSQGFRFADIFRAISKYTKRYAIVEFMPLGLWNGASEPPVPEWYSESNFIEGLSHCFKVISRSNIEKNRIVFFLEKSIVEVEEI